MARLKALPDRLTAPPTRDSRSDRAKEYRALYNTAAWKRRRLGHLASEPLCRMCLAEGIYTAATVADHVTPHRGDVRLFHEGELQSLCQPHHAGRKQAIEVRGFDDHIDASTGWPTDPMHPANRGR